MYAEFYNLSQDKAYYACGSVDDIVGVVSNPNTIDHLVELGDADNALRLIRPTMNVLADLDAGDSFQVRLFTMEPDSLVLTKRIMIRGVYWANWKAHMHEFEFEKAN